MALAGTSSNIETRIARLESDFSRIRSGLGDVKQDVRDLRARVDSHGERADVRFADLRPRFGDNFDKLIAHMEAIEFRLSNRLCALERSLASAKRWALFLYVVQAVGVYTILARTMGWI
jgi:hypothetical protein